MQYASTLKMVSIYAQSQAMGLFLGILRQTKFQEIINLFNSFILIIITYFRVFFDLQIISSSRKRFHFSNLGRVSGHQSKVDPHSYSGRFMFHILDIPCPNFLSPQSHLAVT